MTVIALFYACVVAGVALVVADLAGRLVVDPRRVWAWRVVGLVGGAVTGLAPILALVTDRFVYSGLTFPAVAVAYLAAFVAFAAGVFDRSDRRPGSVALRRLGYVGLLSLAALPSFVLLPLTVPVLVAGAGLVQARPAAGTSRHDSR